MSSISFGKFPVITSSTISLASFHLCFSDFNYTDVKDSNHTLPLYTLILFYFYLFFFISPLHSRWVFSVDLALRYSIIYFVVPNLLSSPSTEVLTLHVFISKWPLVPYYKSHFFLVRFYYFILLPFLLLFSLNTNHKYLKVFFSLIALNVWVCRLEYIYVTRGKRSSFTHPQSLQHSHTAREGRTAVISSSVLMTLCFLEF